MEEYKNKHTKICKRLTIQFLPNGYPKFARNYTAKAKDHAICLLHVCNIGFELTLVSTEMDELAKLHELANTKTQITDILGNLAQFYKKVSPIILSNRKQSKNRYASF